MTITITQEKLVARLALVGCALIVSNHPRPGAACELALSWSSFWGGAHETDG